MQKPAASGPLVGVALVIGSCLSLPFGAAVAAQLFPVLGPWGVTSLRVAIAAVLLVIGAEGSGLQSLLCSSASRWPR